MSLYCRANSGTVNQSGLGKPNSSKSAPSTFWLNTRRVNPALFACVLLVASSLGVRSETSCKVFKAFTTEGRSLSGLIEDTNGWLFGTVLSDTSAGSVFKVQLNGSNYTTLHDFTSIGNDGSKSYSRLLLIGNVLFGTSQLGGVSNLGTIFRLNTDGSSYQLLHHFVGATNDGAFPNAGLAAGSDGSLYGTTIGGGLNNRGTVYKIQTNGAGYQVLRHCITSFLTNGYTIYSAVVLNDADVLFGTTFSGGNRGNGTIFRLNSDGSEYKVLHQFGTSLDGRNVYSKLTRATDGFLYGTTAFGGASNQGTVFKIREDGSEYLTIASFGSTLGDGLRAYQGLSVGTRGDLYGATTAGGTNNNGTIFKILSDGSGYQTICHFATNQSIAADMFLNSQGELYGSLIDPQGADGSLFKLIFPGIRGLGTAANGFNIELSGVSGSSYTVEISEDLLAWRPWITTNLPAPSIQLLDPNPRPDHRFYRAQ
jgi:uncharacterized repeat protein (TIGR03803 family)